MGLLFSMPTAKNSGEPSVTVVHNNTVTKPIGGEKSIVALSNGNDYAVQNGLFGMSKAGASKWERGDIS